VVRVTDVVARSLSGELRADGVVRLSGLRFASAEANVRIPEKDKLDVALEGQALGQVWGSARILAQARGTTREIAVTVDVPKIAFALPASTKSGVQELAPPVKVRAGTYRSAGRFVRLPLDLEDVVTAKAKASAKPEPEDPTTLEIQVNLHEAIVERGNMARVTVEGEPRFLIGDGPSRVMGQIRVREGNVDIRGKKFEVRKGTVTFTGEPANPTVMATATWEAEDGTQVFADFVGPLKTGKVNLRSEPSRPKSEILALVLFGTADGANPTPSARGGGEDGTATKTAVGLGGGLAAQGLTEALDDLAGIQAQARVDTTQANNPRPELEVQITPRISVEVSHVLGTPPLAEPDRNYVSFAWRFRRNWSLDTTLGDRGRALFDAVWQKRY
jgi:translocation and assembly module TamB